MNWEEKEAKRAEDAAYYKTKGKKKCSSCGLYDCICQTTLR